MVMSMEARCTEGGGAEMIISAGAICTEGRGRGDDKRRDQKEIGDYEGFETT